MSEKAVDNETVIELPSYTGLKRVYDYRPYTYHRIRRILANYFDYRLEEIWQGYKANRRENYVKIYRIIRNSDNAVINEGITLDALRRIFAKNDFPLEDEKSASNTKSKRNQKAEYFLEAVNNLSDESKGEN